MPGPGPHEIKLSGPAVTPAWRDLGPAGCGGRQSCHRCPRPLSVPCSPQRPRRPPRWQPHVPTSPPQRHHRGAPGARPAPGTGTPGNRGERPAPSCCDGRGSRGQSPQKLQCRTSDFTATPVALLIHPSAGSVFPVPHQCGVSPTSASPVTPVQDPATSTVYQGPHQCLTSDVPRATPVTPVQDPSARALSTGPHQ